MAVLCHACLWSLVPSLLFGNLHSDTLEAIYWGREWALGYSKHPPLTTWALDSVVRLPLPALFAVMVLAQATVAVTAFFVWRIVRLHGSAQNAALAVLLYLASPAATLYAVQFNHNAMLQPFCAATLFFGLRFFETRRWIDAAAMAIAAALGLYAKYEIAFVLAALAAVAVVVPRYRSVLRHPAAYAAGLLFFALIAPHLWFLTTQDGSSLGRAFGAGDKMTGASTLRKTGINLLVGIVVLFAVPAAILALSRWRGKITTRSTATRRIGMALAIGPLVAMVIGGVLTFQIIKPLWVLPLAGGAAAGLALLFPIDASAWSERAIAKTTAALSAAILALYLVCYVAAAGWIGQPLTAYSADGRWLAAQTEAMWREHQDGPLRCVVIVDRKIGPSGVLWLPSRPDYVDFGAINWATAPQIAACNRSGAVAVLSQPSTALDRFPTACVAQTRRVGVPMRPGLGHTPLPVDLVYIPPVDGVRGCGAR